MFFKLNCYQPRRRYSSLLLETLFAVTLIGISSSFLLSTPFRVYQKHLEILEEVELARIAQGIFLSIQTELRNKHPWDSLKKQSTIFFPLDPIDLELPPVLQKSYVCKYQLSIHKEKEGLDHHTYRLLRCTLYMSSASHKEKKFSFFITCVSKIDVSTTEISPI